MTNEPVQVWTVTPDGKFKKDLEPPCCCECNECDEESDLPMIFEGDPDAICPCCELPIKPGDLTVPIMKWDIVYEGQEEDYPLFGSGRMVHVGCFREMMRRLGHAKR